MSELREAAQAVVAQWDVWDPVVDTGVLIGHLRAALAQPKTELRDQHKAFAEWFLQQNPIAPNVEDMAWAAWKAALSAPDLLATLVDAHDIIDAIGQPETAKVAARMRATIAKAKGES